MREKTQNNVIAVSIGFFLIVLIAITTIFHPFSSKNETDREAEQRDAALERSAAALKISSGELAGKIQRREKLILLDIRPEAEYVNEHIFNSQNIPLSNVEESLGVMGKDKDYVIIDSAALSGSVASAMHSLSGNGFQKVFYLDGGFAAWKAGYHPTISAGNPNSFADQSKVTYIQTDGLKGILETETGLAIIDVRKSSQFGEGHLAGAINIFLDDLEKRKNDIPLGKKIILYDNDGLGAFKAAVRLFDMGFFNVLTLSDGLETWKKKGYETVTTP